MSANTLLLGIEASYFQRLRTIAQYARDVGLDELIREDNNNTYQSQKGCYVCLLPSEEEFFIFKSGGVKIAIGEDCMQKLMFDEPQVMKERRQQLRSFYESKYGLTN